MNPPTSAGASSLSSKTFILLLVLVTIAFGWILLPFYGAVFWGSVLAILFAPLNRYFLLKMKRRRTLAALATLSVILVIVIIPLAFLASALMTEGMAVVAKVQSGDLNFARYFQQIMAALPQWLLDLLDRFGLGDMAAMQDKITSSVTQGSQLIAGQALSIGQNTLDFVVSFFITLYLAFFLLRDGSSLVTRIRDAVPLQPEHKRDLAAKFTTVIRATVKGNVLVAIAQGALGGLAFWVLDIRGAVLWAVLMAFLSLLPAVGAGLVWAPVAIYFLVTGAVWPGIGLIAYGVLVIGLVDNVLRPILVGKDTKMPDYVVLISTLGGMALFGINGFVIGPVVAAMFMAVWSIFSVEQGAAAVVLTRDDLRR
jgi:predicted PurR-regulated permease PerM